MDYQHPYQVATTLTTRACVSHHSLHYKGTIPTLFVDMWGVNNLEIQAMDHSKPIVTW
jgi:hypothetical protein